MFNPLFLIPDELRIKIPFYRTPAMRVPRSTKSKISRYSPHQGKKETIRREKQIKKLNMQLEATTLVRCNDPVDMEVGAEQLK